MSALVTAVVLAAGSAQRFGSPKQLALLRGRPLIRHAAMNALEAGTRGVLVVLGRAEGEVRVALEGLPLNFVLNPRFEGGLSTSLHAAIEALPPQHAALIFLGDQPDVPAGAARAVLAAYRKTGRSIAVPVYGEVPGHPALFGPQLRAELLAVRGDEGGRAVIARDPSRVTRVVLPGPAPLDVDTPEDLRRHAPLP